MVTQLAPVPVHGTGAALRCLFTHPVLFIAPPKEFT
jgi:hypothetical protein